MNTSCVALSALLVLLLAEAASAATVQTVKYDYNGLGQLSHTYAINNGTQVAIATYTYNANGQVATITDVNGKITQYQYDALGRVQSVTDNVTNLTGAGVATTQFAYNALDQLLKVTDPLNQATVYQFDALGNLLARSSPDTGVTTWLAYDAAGNPTAWTDARSNTVQAQYDANNRLQGKQVTPSGKAAQQLTIYTWDTASHGIGQLARVDATAVNSQIATTVFSYTPDGKLAGQTDLYNGQALTVAYSRDSHNRPYQTQYPSGSVASLQYNAFGQPNSLWYGGVALASNINWQPFGPLASVSWINGMSWSDSYDKNGRIASKGVGDGNRVYTWNSDGTLQSIADPNPNLSQAFNRDVFLRLNSWSQNGSSRSWTYDVDDNRTQQIVGAVTEQYTYPHQATGTYTGNRLQSKTGSSPATYSYDASGDTTADANFNYAYDGYGRLSSAQAISGGATVATYIYNGLGQRIAKLAGSNTYRYVYDVSGHVLGEYNNGALIQETRWLGDRPMVTWRLENGNLAGYMVATDHLNTPRELVSLTSGQILWRWDSEPYGVGTPTSLVSGNGVSVTYNLRFPGQVYDAETGTNYNYYRDYNPQIGRYAESDPVGLRGGLNTYAYVNGNPVKYVDPLGLATTVVITYDYGFGSHAAFYTDHGDAGGPSLYDPGGSYLNGQRGSGDLFSGSDANLQTYVEYQQSTGSTVETYTFSTTPTQEQQITNKADSQGGANPGYCAQYTSSALNGTGPFSKLGTYTLPGSLAGTLGSLPGAVKANPK